MSQLFLYGFNRSDFRAPRPLRYSLDGFAADISYNTVEGVNMRVEGTLSRRLPGGVGDLSFSPHFRYGFNNGLVNAWGQFSLNQRRFSREGDEVSSSRQTWTLAGGTRVMQFNPDNPITESVNSFYTLFFRRNYMKIYESHFAELGSATRFDNGMRLNVSALYEDRESLSNSTNWSLIKYADRGFTP